MKKTLITILIILILAGAGYFGDTKELIRSQITIQSITTVIIVIFVAFLFLISRLFILPIFLKSKEKAKRQLGEIFYLINAKKYNLNILFRRPNEHTIYFKGEYKGYSIKCYFYDYLGFSSQRISLSAKPKVIPKKITWFKFRSSYPKIYKDFSLVYNHVVLFRFNIGDRIVSKEEATILLQDLIQACVIVEKGEYTL